jgi:hypothetical protein
MNFNVIKLFVHNKITEIINLFYGWWNEDTIMRYLAIWLMTSIPGTLIMYNVIIATDPTASKAATFLVLLVGFIYYTFGIMVIVIIHLIIHHLYKWISHNIELAKRGIKVKADWKKDGV